MGSPPSTPPLRMGFDPAPSCCHRCCSCAPSDSPRAGKVGPNLISPLQVGLGAVLVLVNACISVYLDLGLEVALAIATVRRVTSTTRSKAYSGLSCAQHSSPAAS